MVLLRPLLPLDPFVLLKVELVYYVVSLVVGVDSQSIGISVVGHRLYLFSC